MKTVGAKPLSLLHQNGVRASARVLLCESVVKQKKTEREHRNLVCAKMNVLFLVRSLQYRYGSTFSEPALSLAVRFAGVQGDA